MLNFLSQIYPKINDKLSQLTRYFPNFCGIYPKYGTLSKIAVSSNESIHLMTIKHLVLFDIDGTLLRTKGAGRTSTRLAMMDVYGTAGRIDQHQFGGKTDWHTLVELLHDSGYDHARIGETMPDFERAMAKHLRDVIHDAEVTVMPMAHEVVRTLREDDGVMIGIVTGNTRSSAGIKLGAAGFDTAWFAVGAYGSEAIDRNDLPKLALARANTVCDCEIQPEHVIIIGDTVRDIECARAVGGVAVAVKTGFEDNALLKEAQPDYLLDDLTGFLDILR